jgi:hypothetical protein
MQVEVLYESEVADQPHDLNVEAIELLKKLGLDAQLDLYTKNAENGVTTDSFPFVPATREQLLVYNFHFPKCTPIEKFKSETIPLRVLQVLDLAKQSGRFECFLILSPQDSTSDDPVLVGIVKEEQYLYNSYLLARWGSSLTPYKQLRDEAINSLKQEVKSKCKDVANKLAKLLSKSEFSLIKDMTIRYNQYSKAFDCTLDIAHETHNVRG